MFTFSQPGKPLCAGAGSLAVVWLGASVILVAAVVLEISIAIQLIQIRNQQFHEFLDRTATKHQYLRYRLSN